MSDSFGMSRIRASVMHFLAGKAVTSVAGFLALVLVVRALSIEDFATYAVLIGLVELLGAISGFGLTHAVLRFVPELYVRNYRSALRTFVSGSLFFRTLFLIFVVASAYFLSEPATAWMGVGGKSHAYEVFLLIVVLRSSSHFVSQVLESALHQAKAQVGFGVATVGRLVGIVMLMQTGHDVALIEVLWVEVISEAAGLAVMLLGLARMLYAKMAESTPTDDDRSWSYTQLRRVLRLALTGYVHHLTIMFYGTPNRLVGGRFLDAPSMAAYGFGLSLIDYVRRYLPAQLLLGVIRPVIVARYSESKDFASAVHTSNTIMKINVILIGLIIAYLLVAGTETISLMSGSKYGHGMVSLLIALSICLLLETQRQQLEVLTQTVELYQHLIPGNLLLSASILPAIVALPVIGAIAFPLLNLGGLIAANIWVVRKLRQSGFDFRTTWSDWLHIGLIVGGSAAVALLAKSASGHWWVGGLVATLTYLVGTWVRFKSTFAELWQLAKVRKTPAHTRSIRSESTDTAPRIVFGLLSCRKSAPLVAQIADCVRPHRIIVHHDFSKEPEFPVFRDNIAVLSSPTTTSWGDWSLVDATLKLMREASKDPQCTHFQLLSETCLPIRPIAELEDFLSSSRPDAMIDLLPLGLNSPDLLVSHGWRYLARTSFQRRVANTASHWWLTREPYHQQSRSINLRLPGEARGVSAVRQVLGQLLMRSFATPCIGAFPISTFKQCCVGGQWFGLSRPVLDHILEVCETFPELVRHFSNCHIPDEAFIHTIVAHTSGIRIFPSNHAVLWEGCGTGPDVLDSDNLGQVQASGKFFARKFPLEPLSHIRQLVLARVQADLPAHVDITRGRIEALST